MRFTMRLHAPESIAAEDREACLEAVRVGLEDKLGDLGLGNETGVDTADGYAWLDFESKWEHDEFDQYAQSFSAMNPTWLVTLHRDDEGDEEVVAIRDGGVIAQHATMMVPAGLLAEIDRLRDGLLRSDLILRDRVQLLVDQFERMKEHTR